MTEIGVRELKSKASEIVRAVREEGAEYIITYRGAAVGVLSPLSTNHPQVELPDLADILEPLLRRVVREELPGLLQQQVYPQPLDPAQAAVANSAWDELTRLGEAIGASWQVPQSSTELLAEMRR